MSEAQRGLLVELHPEEPPEVQERNNWAGARLLVSSTVFLFLPFVFGYLYLALPQYVRLVAARHLKAPDRLGDRDHARRRRQRRARRVGALGARAG